ncbi:MAG: hypothetical protein U0931_19710 [Vulcanimicrobiota bacterium]
MAGGLLSGVATLTTLMFTNLRATINRSGSEMEATQRARLALERIPPLLSAAYLPAISGATGPLETPIAPLASGVSANDPLAGSGPGNDSVLFYACSDLMATNPTLPLPDSITPHLYEIRLQAATVNDPSGMNRTLRALTLQEYNLPAGYGQRPLIAKNNVPKRILSYGLSDLRIWRQSNSALRVQVSVQYRSANLRYSQRETALKTYQFSSNCMLPVTCLR